MNALIKQHIIKNWIEGFIVKVSGDLDKVRSGELNIFLHS